MAGHARLATDSYSLTVIDEHRIGIVVEAPGALAAPDNFTLREPREDEHVYDMVLEMHRTPLDGAEAERPEDVWCWICQTWIPKNEMDGHQAPAEA